MISCGSNNLARGSNILSVNLGMGMILPATDGKKLFFPVFVLK